MKKILLFVLLFAIVILATGCGSKTDQPEKEMEYSSIWGIIIKEWISPDGVHYWISSKGMLSPRYDNNGNIVIDKLNNSNT